MNFYEFTSKNPVLVIILTWIICWTIIDTIKLIVRRKK